jgi:thiol:disulfide interchange protein DsbD
MNKNRKSLYLWLMLIALVPLSVHGQGGGSEKVVKARGHISATAIRPNDTFKVAVVLDVEDGYHINAHVPTLDYLVATKVEFKPPSGITIKEVRYPEPDLKTFAFSPDDKLSVHEGTVIITADAEVSGSIKPGAVAIPARVTVQPATIRSALHQAK